MARYYKQRPKPSDGREDVAANKKELHLRHMNGGFMAVQRITALNKLSTVTKMAEHKATIKNRATQMNSWMRGNVNRNLPRNVPY